jgi:hypothetical protein
MPTSLGKDIVIRLDTIDQLFNAPDINPFSGEEVDVLGEPALLRAVRDNPQRVAALGHNPVRLRWAAHTLAAALAGAAGAVGALVFEIVSPEVLGAQRSGAWMLFTVLGGAQHFWGPLIGGALMVGAQVGLSGITPAWALYVGLLFVLVLAGLQTAYPAHALGSPMVLPSSCRVGSSAVRFMYFCPLRMIVL